MTINLQSHNTTDDDEPTTTSNHESAIKKKCPPITNLHQSQPTDQQSLIIHHQSPINHPFQRRDERMSVVNESMNGIRIIKLFAWEPNFLAKMIDSRAVEMVLLRTYMFTLG